MKHFHGLGRRGLALGLVLAAMAGAVAQGEGGIDSAGADQIEFVYSISPSEMELDPHHAYSANEAQIFTAVHEGLFCYDPQSLEALPALAASYERSRDKTVYTFHLRQGARYSNGDPIRAADVVASWLRILDPMEKAEYSSFLDVIKGARDYRLGKNSDSASIGLKAADDATLIVTLEAPAAYFTKLLCHHSLSVIHPRMLKSGAWDSGANLVSSGPFFIESIGKDGMLLRRSENYWDRANVALPSIKVLYLDDDDEASRRYNAGEIHWLSGAMNLRKILDPNSLRVAKPIFSTNYLYFRCSAKPWNDPKLRKALLLLLPWQSIRSKERYYVPADTLVIQTQGYPEVKVELSQDREAAMGLLEKTGHKDGKNLPEIVLRLSDGEDHKQLGQEIAAAWTQAGLKVRVDNVPTSEYFAALKKNDYTMAAMTWIGDFFDPMAFLQMWTADSNLNDAAFLNREYDSLVRRSMGEEGNKRFGTLAQAETVLLESGACAPLFHSLAVNIVSADAIEGWFPNVLDIHPFKFVKFKNSQPVQGVVRLDRLRP